MYRYWYINNDGDNHVVVQTTQVAINGHIYNTCNIRAQGYSVYLGIIQLIMGHST